MASEIPALESTAAVQVADALSDSAVDTWVSKLATRALQLTAPWLKHRGGHDTLCALLRLPPHLRSRVLSACLANDDKHLPQLLTTFPRALHTALAASATAHGGGKLTAPDADPAVLFPVLSATLMPAPGLLTLEVHLRNNAELEPSSPASAALLAGALFHHSTLKDVSVDSVCSLGDEWLETLAACLPPGAVPQLSRLRLCVCPSSAAALATCLRRFSTIAALSLSFRLTEQPQHLASGMLTSYVGAALAPAQLCHLQDLDITESALPPYEEAPGNGTVQFNSHINSLLQLLDAPAITRLVLTSIAPRLQLSLLDLLGNLRMCGHLQELHLEMITAHLEAPDGADCGGLQHMAGLHTQDEDPPAAPPPLRTFRMHSTGTCFRGRVAVVATIAKVCSQSLTSIDLRRSRDCSPMQAPGADQCSEPRYCKCNLISGEDWDNMIAGLGHCRGLRHAKIPHPDAGERAEVFARAIGQLTRLEHLDVLATDAYSCTLAGHAFAEALSVLTRLQALNIGICSGRMDVDDHERLFSALPLLRSLTQLGLGLRAHRGPRIPLESYTELVPGLPVLRKLVLGVDHIGQGLQREAVNAVAEQFPNLSVAVYVPGEGETAV